LCEEKSEGLAMLSRVSTPLPANPRMENLFEPAFLGGVLKDYRSEFSRFKSPFLEVSSQFFSRPAQPARRGGRRLSGAASFA
jgi:hypothetical protein